jgi:hypothetical protein
MKKYLSSVLFVLATACLAYHEALSTVSKHGTVDLLSTWQWHLSQYGIVLMYTAAGWIAQKVCYYWEDDPVDDFYGFERFNWHDFGLIAGSGLGLSIAMYPVLYHWLCTVII